MNIKELQKNWNEFGKKDPLWSIMALPDKKGNRWRTGEFFAAGRSDVDSLMRHANCLDLNFPRRRALDFGCGVGRLTQALAVHFDDVVGVDIAPSMIKLAKKYNRFGERCQYYLNEADNLNAFSSSSFDLILSLMVFQHMRPGYSKGYIKEFLRILTPDGILVFQLPSERLQGPPNKEPNPPGLTDQYCNPRIVRIKQLIKRVTPNTALRLYWNLRYREPIMEAYGIMEEEVRQLLKGNGAKIVDIEQNNAMSGWRSLQYYVTKEGVSTGVSSSNTSPAHI